MENIYLYHFEREFTVYDMPEDEYGSVIFDCCLCPYARHDNLCCDYCVFSNACLSALEMGWA